MRAVWTAALAAWLAMPACAASAAGFGPFNMDFPEGGDGVSRTLPGGWRIGAAAPWALHGWVELRRAAAPMAIVGGVGTLDRGVLLAAGASEVEIIGGPAALSGKASLPAGTWHLLAASSDGARVTLSVDGRLVAEGTAGPALTPAELRLAPRGVAGFAPFGGRLMGFTLDAASLAPGRLAALAAARPDPDATVFTNASATWPVQLTNAPGLTTPQDPWTLPTSRAAPSRPVAIPAYDGPALQADGPRSWTLPKWRLAAAPDVAADAATLSRPGYDAASWHAATVPGTVLTTLVDRGVYPDPGYGLNNMAIPERLARQDYWYRSEFDAPPGLAEHRVLTFDGINYIADVWLNGRQLGQVRGAFTRGRFDVSGALRPGANAVAVRIHPPLHPGTVDEESLLRGAGFNGGMQAMDGPTFFATEGWDWIPGIRDRNVGLWQAVHLSATGALRLGDPQIVTALPQGQAGSADIEIDVPVGNLSTTPMTADVTATFDDVHVARRVAVAPGTTLVKFTPADFPALSVRHPRLWWPNGYGDPALHTAHIAVAENGTESDTADLRFGMRQITYELSLLDPAGGLRRVEVDYTRARQLGQRITDGRHEAVRKIADGWVNSLTTQGDHSDAVHDLADTRLAPYLILKVNGVRIAARGGSWGTDDMMKRIGRARLEPFFRLHREAGVNIIRNWVGQNTEPVFYDLADEYGLLVTNDFWASTQNFQMEPADVPLFLANAADTIARYRNHPCIALWFGRNEGMPQPILNEGLQDLVYGLDGTRWYNGSSNQVSLWTSGPYNYREPATYFTEHARGFAVEVGSPSFPTLEAFEAAVPASERWPISDSWAYHDWHQDGNGAVTSFMSAMADKLGPAMDLGDFERKAQLLNYETYRAIMEGMNARLWTATSGRMLWMTQPAWLSTMWQIMSHDYDTHAAYYGFKSAAEHVHVQLTLPDYRVQLVNNGQSPLDGVDLAWRILALDGHALGAGHQTVSAGAQLVADGQVLDLAPTLATEGAVVVRLEATASGHTLSRNTYWVTRDAAGARRLSAMVPQKVTAGLRTRGEAGETRVTATLHNDGTAPALNVKLTLLGANGLRILPAYYSDNYVSLLPGETRSVDIAYKAQPGTESHVTLRGWNVVPAIAVPGEAP